MIHRVIGSLSVLPAVERGAGSGAGGGRDGRSQAIWGRATGGLGKGWVGEGSWLGGAARELPPTFTAPFERLPYPDSRKRRMLLTIADARATAALMGG